VQDMPEPKTFCLTAPGSVTVSWRGTTSACTAATTGVLSPWTPTAGISAGRSALRPRTKCLQRFWVRGITAGTGMRLVLHPQSDMVSPGAGRAAPLPLLLGSDRLEVEGEGSGEQKSSRNANCPLLGCSLPRQPGSSGIFQSAQGHPSATHLRLCQQGHAGHGPLCWQGHSRDSPLVLAGTSWGQSPCCHTATLGFDLSLAQHGTQRAGRWAPT